MKRRYLEVDVFGVRPLSGNPLGVVLDSEDLTTEQMQAFANWTNFSETTFLLQPTTDCADYKVRIFTTSRELQFAGHPTLGSCFAWLQAGNIPKDKSRIIQECGAGLITVQRGDNETLAFMAPNPIKFGIVEATLISEIANVLNIDLVKIIDSHWLDNGPGWIGILLSSAEEVLALRPNLVSNLNIGIFGFYESSTGPIYETRAFSSENGILVEDPVTGSLNAAAAQWFIKTGRCIAPYTVSQGLAMKRNGYIQITKDEIGNIWIGGNTKTINMEP